MYDIIIIGAGASGMMAAITAARCGAKTALIEHKNDIGKKVLATGNGRCNFTNKDMSATHFHGSKVLVENGLKRFNEKDCLDFFASIGIPAYDNNGYIYPNSKQASSIVSALRMELNRLKVDIKVSSDVTGIKYDKKKNTLFHIATTTGEYSSHKLIIATGLKASAKLGSDGSIFTHINDLGHHMTHIVPALCGFYCSGLNFKKITGVRCDATVTSVIDNQKCESETGELQLADYGISGIPVFQISSEMSKALDNRKKVCAILDFMPSMTDMQLQDYIADRSQTTTDKRSLNEMLNGLLNNKLLLELIHASGLSPDMKGKDLSALQIEKLTTTIKQTKVNVECPRGLEFAQVCAGGIKTSEIDTTSLESKLIPGLYFAGEILDVDGICGGYNLQWAWSSGYIAGSESSKIYD